MQSQQANIVGTFSTPSRSTVTATGGTAFACLIPPFCGAPSGGPQLLSASASGQGGINFGGALTHVTRVCYTTGATAHLIGFMRPLNYTTAASAAAVNQAVINLTADPGNYLLNYKYPVPGGISAQLANNLIAANDYVAYQLVDGSWILDTVSSMSTLAMTLTNSIPNVVGGGVAAGSLIYWFGISTDKDPATGQTQPQSTIAASQVRDASWADAGGVVSTLHPGDPLVFYSPNTTNQGWLEFACGYYSKGY